MVYGNFSAIGFHPYEGALLPYGFNNLIPNKLRPYLFYYPKTNVPLPHLGMDWSNYPIYPLGMKAIPNRQFTSLNRQMYRAVIDSDFDKIEKIADLNEFDLTKEIILPDLNFTTIGMAAALNQIEIVHYLIKRGIDLEFRIGPFNKTALHIAVEYGNELLAKLLLNNGADLYARDKLGHNVYDKAEFRGYYNFKFVFDYFKDNPRLKNNIDYEDYKYTREVIVEDPNTNTFVPSRILEFSVGNKLIPVSDNEKMNLKKFEFFIFNIFEIKNLEDSNPFYLRKRYDDLNYASEKL